MIVRIGTITGTYPVEGKCQVHYGDTGITADKLPLLTFNHEFKMPEIGDTVLCLHCENDQSTGFVLGTFYNAKVTPPNAGEKYRKEIVKDRARCEYKDEALSLYAPQFLIEAAEGSVTIRAKEVKMVTDHGTTVL